MILRTSHPIKSYSAKCPPLLFLNLLFCALLPCGLRPPASAAPLPTAIKAHPAALPQDFTLPATTGVSRHLSEFRGRPAALFFFCGCPWCVKCAQTWGQFQRGGVFSPDTTSSQSLSTSQSASSSSGSSLPATVIVFSGGADAARAFAAETGLDPAQTTLLLDPELKVTTAYHADPCPRVFVLDSQNSLRYTNNHKNDAARQAPALAIASRALDALRLAASSVSAETAPVAQNAIPAAPPTVSTVPSALPVPSVSTVPTAAPPLSLKVTTLDGKTLDLAALPGWKVLYFWSSACPCVSACENYSFRPLAEKYKGRVAFYAITSGQYDLHLPRPALLKDIRAHHLPYPVVLDRGGHIARALGAQITPQTFLINPQGQILFNGVPDDSRFLLGEVHPHKAGISQAYLAHALSQALAGKPVTVPRVKDVGCIIGY